MVDTKKPARGRFFDFLVAGAGWPSPLRGSVGLGAPNPMLRIGAPRLDLLPRRFKHRSFPNKQGPLFEGPLFVWKRGRDMRCSYSSHTHSPQINQSGLLRPSLRHRMSAFPESGRSSCPKTAEMYGRFRPQAASQQFIRYSPGSFFFLPDRKALA